MVLNVYTDPFQYQRSPSGLESASLVGNLVRVGGTFVPAAGATTLNVTPALTVALNQYDPLTIFDGPNSEVVTVGAAGAAIGATSIPISPLAAVHAFGTPICSNGILGSLSDQIVNASAWVENITRQVLFSTTQTETMRVPSMRASIDNQTILNLRTKQYPITAITGLSMGTLLANPVSYDASQAVIDANEQVSVPQLLPTGSGSSTYSLIAQQVSRQQNAYVQVTYTAGYTAANMPGDVRDAAILLTSALLSRRMNPTGADAYDLGDRKIQATQRGDPSPDSLLVKDAKAKLAAYTLRIF